MKAIILAAGRGSRMGERTLDLPKCRTPFFGKELIDWQLQSLSEAGIKDIAIVTGYLQDTFKYDTHYFNNPKWDQTNMVMTLMEAQLWLEKEECIISYSDIVYSKSAVIRLAEDPATFSILYDQDWKSLWEIRMDDPLSDAESFKLDSRSHLIEIGNKTDSYTNIEGQYIGLIKSTPQSFGIIKKILDGMNTDQKNNLDFTSLLNICLQKGHKIKAIPIEDQWYEVDSEQDLQSYLSWRSSENIFEKLKS